MNGTEFSQSWWSAKEASDGEIEWEKVDPSVLSDRGSELGAGNGICRPETDPARTIRRPFNPKMIKQYGRRESLHPRLWCKKCGTHQRGGSPSVSGTHCIEMPFVQVIQYGDEAAIAGEWKVRSAWLVWLHHPPLSTSQDPWTRPFI